MCLNAVNRWSPSPCSVSSLSPRGRVGTTFTTSLPYFLWRRWACSAFGEYVRSSSSLIRWRVILCSATINFPTPPCLSVWSLWWLAGAPFAHRWCSGFLVQEYRFENFCSIIKGRRLTRHKESAEIVRGQSSYMAFSIITLLSFFSGGIWDLHAWVNLLLCACQLHGTQWKCHSWVMKWTRALHASKKTKKEF